MNDIQGISARITLLMSENGWTQAELARLLGVTQPAVSNYLTGRVPPATVIVQLADLAGCSTDWLLRGHKTPATVMEATAGYATGNSTDLKLARLPAGIRSHIVALIDHLLKSSESG
jgi:transcriptional regulator with XRE-family HTH domain